MRTDFSLHVGMFRASSTENVTMRFLRYFSTKTRLSKILDDNIFKIIIKKKENRKASKTVLVDPTPTHGMVSYTVIDTDLHLPEYESGLYLPKNYAAADTKILRNVLEKVSYRNPGVLAIPRSCPSSLQRY